MQPPDRSRARGRVKLLSLCTAALALATVGVFFVAKSKSRSSEEFRRRGGYDFGTHMNLEWSGPKAGERIDLQRFSGPGGEKITDTFGGEILMLATVDPDCAASRVARDELYDVRENLAGADVPYVLVSATVKRPPEEFYKYAASLGVAAPAFIWSSKEGPPPESLLTMVVPSHLLVRRDGTILRTWPGSSQDKKLRFHMVNQIVADTLDIVSGRR